MRRAARFYKKRAAHIFCFINRITVYKSIIRRFIPQSKIFFRLLYRRHNYLPRRFSIPLSSS